jgi:hypothetical protein
MKPEKMLSTKKPVSDPDPEGWRDWRNINTVRAVCIGRPFIVKLSNGDSINGKAGDVFVDGGSSQWIVDAEIFKKSYVEA